MSCRGEPKRGGPPVLGVGRGGTKPHRKKKNTIMKHFTWFRSWIGSLAQNRYMWCAIVNAVMKLRQTKRII